MSALLKKKVASKVLKALRKEPSTTQATTRLGQLFQFGPASGDFVELQAPTQKLLQELSVTDTSGLHNLCRDGLIERVSKVNRKNEELLSLSIKRETILKSVLSSEFVPNTLERCDRKTIVEFSSPNIAKPFHMGHLRSTIVGNFVANLEELTGEVVRMNYLGDWGTQMGFIMIGLDQMGVDPLQLKNNTIKAICEAYVLANSDPKLLPQARSAFTAMERGEDTLGLQKWSKIRDFTRKYLEETYQRLGITFDEYYWESQYPARVVQPLVSKLKEIGLASQCQDHTKLSIDGHESVLLKSDGSTLYLARDIASALDRLERHKCQRAIYVVDKSQEDHMSLLRLTINRVLSADCIVHVPFGRVAGMSTRKGSSVLLSDILDKAVEKMSEQQQKSPNTRSNSSETTTTLGLSALVVYILKQRRLRDFKFDWNQALQSNGDTGVKLQYTHCRLTSLQRKVSTSLPSECHPELLKEPICLELIVEMAKYDDILRLCWEERESSVLVNYLFKLSNLVSKALATLPVKTAPQEVAEQRALMFHRCRVLLNSSMKLLGIVPLDEM